MAPGCCTRAGTGQSVACVVTPALHAHACTLHVPSGGVLQTSALMSHKDDLTSFVLVVAGFHQQQSQHQQQQSAAQQPHHKQLPSAATEQQQDPRSIALVTTDVCLKVLHKDLLPLGPSLLIQYDLPSTKVWSVRPQQHSRRCRHNLTHAWQVVNPCWALGAIESGSQPYTCALGTCSSMCLSLQLDNGSRMQSQTKGTLSCTTSLAGQL